jgi:valyl-tRNA synthetase
MTSYKLIYDDFCGWLLEIIKPEYQQPIDAKTLQHVIRLLENNLRIMHPFTPFITEEIWQNITNREVKEALCINTWPDGGVIDTSMLADFELLKEVIAGIRTVRKEKQITFKKEIDLKVINNENLDTVYDALIQKMGNVASIDVIKEQLPGAVSYRVKSNEYFIPLEGAIDIKEELEKLKAELERAQGFLKAVQKKLSNERFVTSAPAQVVAIEKKKEADALAKINTLKSSINALK